jgi:glyoxylase-like metal-dependent hydrolase (beta-lactamase superfamily II)
VVKIGNFELHELSDGEFSLDGGAMFGVVPKLLWQKTNPADLENRITLALRPLLVNTKNELVLVDTGIGDKCGDSFREIYKINHSSTLDDSLKKIGITPPDIDIVIITHLHFDHTGGSTTNSGNGDFIPHFPKARHFIQKLEWDVANNPDPRSRASYLKENFQPLDTGQKLNLVNGNALVVDGIRSTLTGGHTQGHQVVFVESKGETAIYWGDLIPTANHLRIPYVMGYDLFPLITMKRKEELLAEASKNHWLSIFEHDPNFGMGYLSADAKGRITCQPIKDGIDEN